MLCACIVAALVLTSGAHVGRDEDGVLSLEWWGAGWRKLTIYVDRRELVALATDEAASRIVPILDAWRLRAVWRWLHGGEL